MFQVAGVVSCCLLLVVLLAIGPYFRTLPNVSTITLRSTNYVKSVSVYIA